MSKDMMPCDLYIADRAIAQMRGSQGLRDMEIAMNFNGQSIPLGNKDAKADFPELSFLYGDCFHPLYEQHRHPETKRLHPEAKRVFQEFETALKNAEEALLNQSEPLSRHLTELSEEEFLQQQISVVVEEWFFGRLDDGFYYNTYNNEKLLEFMTAKVDEQLRPWEKWCSSHDKPSNKPKGVERE